ncbi:class I SAM-dependent methyltransferase [bacterium]|nr:class I SAM-dependent methyltransferase [bacterium]
MTHSFEYFRSCPICSSSSVFPFKKRTFHPHQLTSEHIKITDSQYGKHWDLSLCKNCGHIFANPCPSPRLIHSLARKIEDPAYEEEAKGRSRNFHRVLSHLGKIHPEKGILFDVGAASGLLLNEAQKKGWKAEGIEASRWAVQLAREKYHIPLKEGYFESASIKENHCTAVTMVDFIEHIPHPLEAVHKAYQILIPGGTLCLVTPDIHSTASHILGSRWWHLRPAHLGYFSIPSLQVLLRRGGFQSFHLRKYSWTFSLHYIFSRVNLFQFLLKNQGLSSLWKKIPVKLVIGDSLEIYAQKKGAT